MTDNVKAEVTGAQLARELRARSAARRERKLQEAARYLQEHKAWNWVWPDSRNRWQTNARPIKGPACVYKGPSKSVVARRRRRGHKVVATRFASAAVDAS